MAKQISQSATVLVVNDRTDGRELTNLLKTSGCYVIEEDDLQNAVDNALDFTRAKRPDLILIDFDSVLAQHSLAIRMMKESGELKSVPIIAVACSTWDNVESKATAIGFDGFIVNPIDLGQIKKLLGYLSLQQRVKAA